MSPVPARSAPVAVIAGACGGIGRAVAVLFAREGADVAVLHLDEAKDAEFCLLYTSPSPRD